MTNSQATELVPRSVQLSSRARNFSAQPLTLPLILLAAHIPLGFLLYLFDSLALVHPIGVLSLGMYFAISKHVPMRRVAYVVAYLIGAEVLWRMARLDIYWEFGKFSAALIMITALVQRRNWEIPKLPFLYLVLLVPSCIVTLLVNDFDVARDELSFNMSGPFVLVVSCWFFSHLSLTSFELKKLLAMPTLPLISVAVISLFYTVMMEGIQFGDESNVYTSGGFGPNQVSSMLGMGVFLCVGSYLLFKNDLKNSVLLCALALLFTVQSVLTFSRGGIYNAIGAIVILALVSLQRARNGAKRLIPAAGLALIFLFIIFPSLNDFTGGALQTRFENADSTGRLEIVVADIDIFFNNPIFGLGVGEAKEARESYFGKPVGAHTEFARVAAEHGIFGVFALLFLFAGVVHQLRNNRLVIARALLAGSIVWSCLFMMNAGMRLAAPSFLWGLGFVGFSVSSPSAGRRLQGRNFRPLGSSQYENHRPRA